MRISICTTTARPGYADLMAHMIAVQDYPKSDLEWVLVDFAYEGRAGLMKKLGQNLGLTIIHVPNVRDNHLFFRDITRNRNLALKKATGDAVIFLDDYAMIPKEFVKEHANILMKGNLSAGRMFRLEHPIGDPSFDQNNENSPVYLYRSPPIAFEKYAKFIGQDGRDRGSNNFYKATGITYTGNLGIPRAIFEPLNGFDPRMESGLEDCDFGLRATMCGFTTYYNPKAYTINMAIENAPYTYRYDHPHDVEPFISNQNNKFRGNAKLSENEFLTVKFFTNPTYRIATCKICGATCMIDPNELMAYKDATREWRVPAGLSGGYF